MSKVFLTLEDEFDFDLFGISCHARDYRLCWELNSKLKFDFQRTEDYEVRQQRELISCASYEYTHEEDHINYYIIANRGENGFVVPEQKQADYFLIIKGSFNKERKEELMEKIRALNSVLAIYELDPNGLKSKRNLLF